MRYTDVYGNWVEVEVTMWGVEYEWVWPVCRWHKNGVECKVGT